MQIDSEIPNQCNHLIPVQIPLVHITKREELPLLFHDCIECERECCNKKTESHRGHSECIIFFSLLNNRVYYIVYWNCIKKLVYFNEPIYHGVQACLYQCDNKKGNPYVQLQCIRTCYKSLFRENLWYAAHASLSLSLSLSLSTWMYTCTKNVNVFFTKADH